MGLTPPAALSAVQAIFRQFVEEIGVIVCIIKVEVAHVHVIRDIREMARLELVVTLMLAPRTLVTLKLLALISHLQRLTVQRGVLVCATMAIQAQENQETVFKSTIAILSLVIPMLHVHHIWVVANVRVTLVTLGLGFK